MKKIPIEDIIDILENIYPEVSPPLNFRNNFELLVAVMLSAQTTDKMVNKVTPKLFEIAPNPFEMAKLGKDKIKEIIKTVGLSNTKSKNLELLSKKIIDDFKGKVPLSFEELVSLPGIGEKTAQVVLIHGSNIPAFPVDTHILRVTKRWGISKEKTAPKCSNLMKKLFPKNLWEKLHLQIIFFGRETCKAINPKCNECPFNKICPKFGIKK